MLPLLKNQHPHQWIENLPELFWSSSSLKLSTKYPGLLLLLRPASTMTIMRVVVWRAHESPLGVVVSVSVSLAIRVVWLEYSVVCPPAFGPGRHYNADRIFYTRYAFFPCVWYIHPWRPKRDNYLDPHRHRYHPVPHLLLLPFRLPASS